MKTWYRAVCDNHREMIHVMVSNPTCTAHYLGESDEAIQAWLERHTRCNLRLIHRDDELEAVLGPYGYTLGLRDELNRTEVNDEERSRCSPE